MLSGACGGPRMHHVQSGAIHVLFKAHGPLDPQSVQGPLDGTWAPTDSGTRPAAEPWGPLLQSERA